MVCFQFFTFTNRSIFYVINIKDSIILICYALLMSIYLLILIVRFFLPVRKITNSTCFSSWQMQFLACHNPRFCFLLEWSEGSFLDSLTIGVDNNRCTSETRSLMVSVTTQMQVYKDARADYNKAIVAHKRHLNFRLEQWNLMKKLFA